MPREDEAREPEREEGGVLDDGVGGRAGEEVADPGGVVRLLAGAAVEAEADGVERGLVGAPVARQRRRDRAAVRGEAAEEGDVEERDGGLSPEVLVAWAPSQPRKETWISVLETAARRGGGQKGEGGAGTPASGAIPVHVAPLDLRCMGCYHRLPTHPRQARCHGGHIYHRRGPMRHVGART